MSAGERDVVVVGGGLLGLLVAEQLAQRHRSVEVLVSPRPDPRSDSQRNHSWLQSGLLYPDNEHARKMYSDGLEMLESFGYPPPTKGGVFRFSSEQEVKVFFDHANKIKLRGKVKEISDDEARTRLGVFYQRGCFHFEVPDAPFPEAALMELARARARAFGAQFRECYVTFERDERAANGYVVVAGGQRMAPTTTISCAGAGTPGLLRALNLAHPLTVSQSVLLVIDDATQIRVPLLADRTSGLTVVSWNRFDSPPRGRLVIGAAERRSLPPEAEDLDRRILPSEEAFLRSLLPPGLNVEKRMQRFTSGQKTDVLVDGRPTIAPWVYAPKEFPGLVFGTPGKATLAYAVAQRILSHIEQPSKPGGANPGEGSGEPPPGTLWHAPIRGHHEPEYDSPHKRRGR
jgi:glycine/D-amino acid oxidase-like deaminating enzyme